MANNNLRSINLKLLVLIFALALMPVSILVHQLNHQLQTFQNSKITFGTEVAKDFTQLLETEYQKNKPSSNEESNSCPICYLFNTYQKAFLLAATIDFICLVINSCRLLAKQDQVKLSYLTSSFAARAPPLG